jgi:hypothetical protein
VSYVLDSSAVVAWLKAEFGGRRVAKELASRDAVVIHALNLVEVDDYFIRRAGSKHIRPIALAGTFAVALAAVRGATLLRSDRADLEKIAAARICELEFIR